MGAAAGKTDRSSGVIPHVLKEVIFTVYIPPFWCGVIATLLVEIGLVIGLVMIMTITKNDAD